MAFSKYDPDRPEAGPEEDFASPQARRRAWLLRYGWWITVVYTAFGFVMLALFWWQGRS